MFSPSTGISLNATAPDGGRRRSPGKLLAEPPFGDGDKRIGFAATCVFLAINGLTIVADPVEVFTFIDGLHSTRSDRSLLVTSTAPAASFQTVASCYFPQLVDRRALVPEETYPCYFVRSIRSGDAA